MPVLFEAVVRIFSVLLVVVAILVIATGHKLTAVYMTTVAMYLHLIANDLKAGSKR